MNKENKINKRFKKSNLNKSPWKSILYSQKLAPYVFVLPFILTFLIFFIYPIIRTSIMSFQDISIGRVNFIGLNNYIRLFKDSTFYIAVRNSVTYTILTLAILIPLPLLFAWMLNSRTMIGQDVFKSLLFIPILTSVVVAGITFRFMFNSTDKALANSLVILLGGEKIQWLSRRWPAMMVMVLLCFWRWAGMNTVYFLAGLKQIPEELYEAADIDGANGWNKFRYISLPCLRPTMIYVLTISIYGGLSMITEYLMLWGGKSSPQNIGLTIVGYIYQKGINQNNMGYASCVGLILLFIVLAINLVILRTTGVFGKERD